MKKLETFATVKAGKLAIKQREKFTAAISDLPEGQYCLTLEKLYSKRSTQQNKVFWGIAYKYIKNCLVEAYGESVSDNYVHEFCRKRFLPGEYIERLKAEHSKIKPILNEKTGEVLQLPFRLTTTKLTTIEAMEYFKNMQRFCAEFFGVEIPDPE